MLWQKRWFELHSEGNRQKPMLKYYKERGDEQARGELELIRGNSCKLGIENGWISDYMYWRQGNESSRRERG